MGYEAVAGALRDVIADVPGYGEGNVAHGDAANLAAGLERAAVIHTAPGMSREEMSLGTPVTERVAWIFRVEICVPPRGEPYSQASVRLMAEVGRVADALAARPTLNGTPGVVDVAASLAVQSRSGLADRPEWLARSLEVRVTELDAVVVVT
jgi:hypothetical protein